MTELKKAFVDGLYCYKKNHPKEWEKKYRIATHRVLSSAFFYISGKTTFKNNNKMTAIAYYYALYHLSKGLLILLPKYSVESLRNMNHTKTSNSMQSDFVQRKMLSEDFVLTLDYLKQIREQANYSMGSWIELHEILEKQEPKVKKWICKGLGLLKEICADELSNIMALIGDGIGDDWMDSYISREEERAVIDFLLENRITT